MTTADPRLLEVAAPLGVQQIKFIVDTGTIISINPKSLSKVGILPTNVLFISTD